VLSVVRSHPAQERPYTGLVEIRSGEIADDLANYLADSEQVGVETSTSHVGSLLAPAHSTRPAHVDWHEAK